MKRILFALLLLASLSFPEEHPVFSESNSNALENFTTYTFTTLNSFNTSTSAFRLSLTADFNWFNPKNFNYTFKPDGIEGNTLYWDIPPLLPNESTEVSFTVNGVVGLPESIDVTTEPLSEWNGTCAFLRAYNSSNSIFYIMDFLNETNRSQGVTSYYDAGNLVLAKLEGYGSFAVFSVNGTKVTPVSDPDKIRALVQSYVSAASPATQGNTSALYQALLDTENLKQKPELECYNLTGMDRFPCTNRTSCMYACFSVPVCAAIGESGWDFMDTLMDYNKSVTDANAKLQTAIGSSEIFSKEPSYSNAENAFNDMVTLNRAETKVIFHPLFTTYDFCSPPDYGMGEQTSARREVLDYLASTCLDGELDGIVDEAVKVAPLLAARTVNVTNRSVSNQPNVSISIVPNQTQPVPNKTIANETAAPSQPAFGYPWWTIPLVIFVVWVLFVVYLAYWKTRDL